METEMYSTINNLVFCVKLCIPTNTIVVTNLHAFHYIEKQNLDINLCIPWKNILVLNDISRWTIPLRVTDMHLPSQVMQMIIIIIQNNDAGNKSSLIPACDWLRCVRMGGVWESHTHWTHALICLFYPVTPLHYCRQIPARERDKTRN